MAPPAPTNITVSQSFSGVPGFTSFITPLGPDPTIFTISSATGQTPQLSGSLENRSCILWRFQRSHQRMRAGHGPSA